MSKNLEEILLDKIKDARVVEKLVIDKDVKNFTSTYGIYLRKILYPLVKNIVSSKTKRKVILDNYPKLDKNKPYLFLSTHSMEEDIIGAMSTLDRNAYFVIGTTDQVINNPQMIIAWLNGIIYLDKHVQKSKSQLVDKIDRIFKHKSSCWICPEGGYNNRSDVVVEEFFSGYILSWMKSGIDFVPVSPYANVSDDECHMLYGDAINISDKLRGYDFNRAKDYLRKYIKEVLGSLMYTNIFNYAETINYTGDNYSSLLDNFYQERLEEYLRVNWSSKEEILYRELVLYSKNLEGCDHIEREHWNKVTEERQRFKKYVEDNYDKTLIKMRKNK